MFYVVCTYIIICVVGLIFLPSHIPEVQKEKNTIFEKDENVTKCENEIFPQKNSFDEIVDEMLKDVSDLP